MCSLSIDVWMAIKCKEKINFNSVCKKRTVIIVVVKGRELEIGRARVWEYQESECEWEGGGGTRMWFRMRSRTVTWCVDLLSSRWSKEVWCCIYVCLPDSLNACLLLPYIHMPVYLQPFMSACFHTSVSACLQVDQKNVPTLVVFKNSRYTINARCPSTIVKRNPLAFYPYPTFVIPITSMDTIPKAITVVALK